MNALYKKLGPVIAIIFFSFTSIIGFKSAKAEIKRYIKVLQADTIYLANIIVELEKKWPDNKNINLVFHGHSVPSGYQRTPLVTTFGSYPLLTLHLIVKKYPFAVVNIIRTSFGGENAEQGAERFKQDVLTKQPDVIFIDYALNDRGIGLERAKVAWEKMIREALEAKVKLVLLTPTPDLNEDIKNPDAPLAQNTKQIIELGKKYEIPVIDSYGTFKKLAMEGEDLKQYMAQNNHINPKGHAIVAGLIANLFNANTE